MKKYFSIKFFLLLISIKNMRNNLINRILKFFKNSKTLTIKETLLNIFIITHKDFKNYRYNPAYKIIANDPSKLNNTYNLEVFYGEENNKLKDMDAAYGEMSKFYHVYNLYKKGKISSKYVGFNHYRRYFSFLDEIPDLEQIFNEYDVILIKTFHLHGKNEATLRQNYCKYHLCKNFDEMIEIIKDKRPEYYEAAIEASNSDVFYQCNMFIMKKQDFINFSEFMFEILFEFDKRHNFKTAKDLEIYMKQYFHGKKALFQVRAQGFLSERISTIFYRKYFNDSRIKTYPMTIGFPKSEVKQSIIDKFSQKIDVEVIKEEFSYIKIIAFLIILSILIVFIIFFNWKRRNKKKKAKKKLRKKVTKSKAKKLKNIFSSSEERTKFNS